MQETTCWAALVWSWVLKELNSLTTVKNPNCLQNLVMRSYKISMLPWLPINSLKTTEWQGLEGQVIKGLRKISWSLTQHYLLQKVDFNNFFFHFKYLWRNGGEKVALSSLGGCCPQWCQQHGTRWYGRQCLLNLFVFFHLGQTCFFWQVTWLVEEFQQKRWTIRG